MQKVHQGIGGDEVSLPRLHHFRCDLIGAAGNGFSQYSEFHFRHLPVLFVVDILNGGFRQLKDRFQEPGEPAEVQCSVHRLKAIGWPDAVDVDNWQADAERFRGDAADRFTPSMRQRLDMTHIYRRALRAVPARMDGKPPLSLPTECPWSLDEMLSDDKP